MSRFLIISNGRTGSTWLSLMLGQLSDVIVDHDLKCRPHHILPLAPSSLGKATLMGKKFKLISLHKEYSVPGFSMKSAFDELESRVNRRVSSGMKLTFDPRAFTLEDQAITRRVVRGYSIIHVTRNLHDILLSSFRGFYHEGTDVPIQKDVWLKDAVLSLSDLLKRELIQRHHRINHIHFPGFLWRLIRNDRFTYSLSRGSRYFRVEYEEIRRRFWEIAKFIGSASSREEAAEILVSPPTRKLTHQPLEQTVDVDSIDVRKGLELALKLDKERRAIWEEK